MERNKEKQILFWWQFCEFINICHKSVDIFRKMKTFQQTDQNCNSKNIDFKHWIVWNISCYFSDFLFFLIYVIVSFFFSEKLWYQKYLFEILRNMHCLRAFYHFLSFFIQKMLFFNISNNKQKHWTIMFSFFTEKGSTKNIIVFVGLISV